MLHTHPYVCKYLSIYEDFGYIYAQRRAAASSTFLVKILDFVSVFITAIITLQLKALIFSLKIHKPTSFMKN